MVILPEGQGGRAARELDRETRMTISLRARHGQSGRAMARILGVDESTVRYHVERQATGATDGRSRQEQKADKCAEAIAHYLEARGEDGPVNLADLHDWLIAEHDFAGSLRGLQRYF